MITSTQAKEILSLAYTYANLEVTAEMAESNGHPNQAEKYSKRAEETRKKLVELVESLVVGE